MVKEGLPVYVTKKYFLARIFRAERGSLKASDSPETTQIDRKQVSDDWTISMETLQKNPKRFFFSNKKTLVT